jgi:hypothetical protein
MELVSYVELHDCYNLGATNTCSKIKCNHIVSLYLLDVNL